jgi:DUF2934 family protein
MTLEDPDFRLAVASRAYQFYESRGREDGHDEEDWYRAEADLVAGAAGWTPGSGPSVPQESEGRPAPGHCERSEAIPRSASGLTSHERNAP